MRDTKKEMSLFPWGTDMPNEQRIEPDADRPTLYQIRLGGHLGQPWTDWFAGLTITLEEDGTTLLQGPVIDQAALHGLLKKVRDLGLPLLSVMALGSSAEMDPDPGGQHGSLSPEPDQHKTKAVQDD